MNNTVDEIRQILTKTAICDLPKKISEYSEDERVSVKKMLLTFGKKYDAYLNELERMRNINIYENKYYKKGIEFIAGVDEVGRGPLAGPVLTAAVILPRNCEIIGIDDSKKLSEKKREELFVEISQKAISIGIGIVSSKTIDDINIRQATLKAMAKAVENLDKLPQVVLVDAERIPNLSIAQEAIIKGDQKSISIAAASIIAKVTRDNMMRQYSDAYPEYGFESNKGYGSKSHMQAIEDFGICPIHRKSFTIYSKKKLF